jgi:hypothetical protein
MARVLTEQLTREPRLLPGDIESMSDEQLLEYITQLQGRRSLKPAAKRAAAKATPGEAVTPVPKAILPTGKLDF